QQNTEQRYWEPYRPAGLWAILWQPCLPVGLFQTTAGVCCFLSQLFRLYSPSLFRNWFRNQNPGSVPDCNGYMRLPRLRQINLSKRVQPRKFLQTLETAECLFCGFLPPAFYSLGITGSTTGCLPIWNLNYI